MDVLETNPHDDSVSQSIGAVSIGIGPRPYY